MYLFLNKHYFWINKVIQYHVQLYESTKSFAEEKAMWKKMGKNLTSASRMVNMRSFLKQAKICAPSRHLLNPIQLIAIKNFFEQTKSRFIHLQSSHFDLAFFLMHLVNHLHFHISFRDKFIFFLFLFLCGTNALVWIYTLAHY